ncbi:hypothetical protein HT576_09070 [Haloterrigena sp. SYSU A121-1]|uniref:DUF7344 domain-containing protein n=1 Tax=Haloterrigena gelatinilytica TaxID=2741724 RepID=A0A8J8GL22_9EURY|nr:hypothetical protein [Haloterrigena gelatinilytica]NUB91170.1 hypothetical protein [Haloterrigena gelatinilytica]
MDQHDAQKLPHRLTVVGEESETQSSLLCHRYRQYIIQRLQTADRPLMLDRLAIELAARTHDKPVDYVALETADDLRTTLRDDHLLPLVDASIIAYDELTGKLTLTEQAADLTPSEAVSD